MGLGKLFQKNKEDFICESCGTENHGTGFTNHCTNCLTSKHVDKHPGDRAVECGGLMPVSDIQHKGKHVVLIQKCDKCGFTRNDYFRDGSDNFDGLLAVTNRINAKR